MKSSLSTLFSSPLAPLLTRPYLDQIILSGLQKHFFPISRLWAAAQFSGLDIGEFERQSCLKIDNNNSKKLTTVLRQFNEQQIRSRTTDKLWEEALFSSKVDTNSYYEQVEKNRLKNRTLLNMERKKFSFLKKSIDHSVLLNPISPEELENRFGGIPAIIDRHFDPVDIFPQIELSNEIVSEQQSLRWIKFKSPNETMNDTVYARVQSPLGISDPPTLIFGHGIAVDFDHYQYQIDELLPLVKMGIRVIRPEAPWHGRRAPIGRYSGEELLSRTPGGMFDFIAAQHKEWSILINWSRETSTAPIAIGGSSLGAQTAKTIAMRALNWPKALRPDALFISTHCRHISEAALDGSLSDIWNLTNLVKQSGWSRNLARHWLEMIDPSNIPAVPAENVVSLLGLADTVTPFSSGAEHMQEWKVPTENLFEYNRGHFTVPLGLLRDHRPLIRLKDILSSIA